MIAASKMRRAQEAALRGRPYSELINRLLSNLATQPQDEDSLHPLLQSREIKNVQVIVITPDRGMTGGLNANINRATAQFILEQQRDGKNVTVISVGRKGRDFFNRTLGSLRAVFINLGDRPILTDVTPVAQIAVDDYANREVDAIYVAYAHFVNTTVQRPTITQLLPVVPPEENDGSTVEYIYEPNSQVVLSSMLPRYIDMSIYHAVLEAAASEQSARMVAMRNATDNANAMADDLTLDMNKLRQEAVTNELLDIVGGASAVSG